MSQNPWSSKGLGDDDPFKGDNEQSSPGASLEDSVAYLIRDLQRKNSKKNAEIRRLNAQLNTVKEVADDATALVEENSSKAQDELKRLKANSNKKINDLKATVEEVNRSAQDAKQDIEKRQDELDRQVKTDRLQSIQILAIFVAFFTFVSVTFQLFSSMNDPLSVLSLITLLFGALIVFACLVIRGLSSENQELATPENVGRLARTVRSFRHNYILILASAIFMLGVASFVWAKRIESERYSSRSTACNQIRAKLLNPSVESSYADRLQMLYKDSDCGVLDASLE